MKETEYIRLTPQEQEVIKIQKAIVCLPPAKCEACHELADHFRRSINRAGIPVGRLALALVAAEINAE